MTHLLTLLVVLPLVCAGLVYFLGRDAQHGAARARWGALVATLGMFFLSLALLPDFDSSSHAFQFVEKAPWFVGYDINYHLGIDGISLWLVLLTTFLMPICVACSWKSITTRVGEFMALFLILEALVIGTFVALDLLLFYLFFEAVLIPMYLIIGIWGGKNRIYAAYKFFLYTLAGSVLFLLAVLYLYFTFNTTDIPTLMAQVPSLGLATQKWLWLAFFASFAVKVPMWPVHTWLPDAHVQAPTAGSVILAGILLKLGAYGFLRFSLPMLPDASHYYADFVFVLSIIAVVYTSLVALVQEDMKKLIAYSSVAHMGFVTLGIFSFTQQGVDGAVFQMISHGVVSGALFLCVGVVYDQLHTREIKQYGGVVQVMPYFAAFFMLFTMASAGLPATSGFVGEILVLVGSYQAAPWATAGAATGLVLGAAYMLWLYRRVMFGEITNPQVREMNDANRIQWLYFVPLAVAVLWLGIHPTSVSRSVAPSVTHLLAQVAKQAEPAVTEATAEEPSPEMEDPDATPDQPATTTDKE
ncbi:MAG: NADH-quinone oxidoreductase subunit M [Alphaproteobacteria bacterium]|nr:NADH-quinone oxidoreductase subunit M [Alphaproteobacteria bacterium]